jgi:transcriptional regulator with XRE-family HTH domain
VSQTAWLTQKAGYNLFMAEFGEFLHKCRAKKELSQDAVARRVTAAAQRRGSVEAVLHQSVYSRWENGQQTPSAHDPLVSALEEVFELAEGTLSALIVRTKGLAGIDGTRLTPAFEEIQRFITDVGPKKIQIWVIGTAHLAAAEPGPTGEHARNIWAKNIREGVRFNFLWFLDAIDTYAFRQLARSMIRVCETLKAEKLQEGGCFHHHATWSPSTEEGIRYKKRLEENRLLYETLRGDVRELAPFMCCDEPKFEVDVAHDLMPFFLGFGSCSLLVPETMRATPVAAVVLREMMPSMAADKTQPFVSYLPPRYVSMMLNAIRDFESLSDSNSKPG